MKGPAGYIRSYYTATAPLPLAAPALRQSVVVDVAVVGAGLAGCSAALELAERGYRVALLEAERAGHGASGRNGGQVLPGYAKGLAELERHVGAADARKLWDLSVAGVQLLRQRIDRYAIACDWVSGQLYVADKARQVAELAAWQDELVGRCDYLGTQLLDRDETAQLLATGRYLGALYDPAAGHLHPLRYTLGLARAAVQAGVQLYEHTRVTGWSDTASGGLRLRTLAGDSETAGAGEVHCQHLLLTAGATLGRLAPRLSRRIMPVGTYIIATEPLGAERAAALIRNNASVADLNWIIDYFRRSADHRLLFGGRVSYSGLHEGNTERATRARMLRIFAQLADVRIEYRWGGYLDITLNRAPDFGRLGHNVWYLQGFCGHGLALTGIAGRLAAESIAGTSERFDLFARIRHRNFPGGRALRRPALVVAMLWYRLRDLW